MRLFSSPSGDDRNVEGDSDGAVTVEKGIEKEYTEHTGVAKFVDGTEQEFTFDAMKERDGVIVLKDYEGFSGMAGGFYGPAFATIPHKNLKIFETVDRKTKTMDVTIEKEVPEGEVDGE